MLLLETKFSMETWLVVIVCSSGVARENVGVVESPVRRIVMLLVTTGADVEVGVAVGRVVERSLTFSKTLSNSRSCSRVVELTRGSMGEPLLLVGGVVVVVVGGVVVGVEIIRVAWGNLIAVAVEFPTVPGIERKYGSSSHT